MCKRTAGVLSLILLASVSLDAQPSPTSPLGQGCHDDLRTGAGGIEVTMERIRARATEDVLVMALRHLEAHRSDRAAVCLRKESLYQSWNSQWEGYQRYLFTHDTMGRLEEELVQGRYSWGWENEYLEIHGYAGWLVTTSVLSSWTGSGWNDMRRLTMTYEGNLIKTITHEVNDFGDWENMLRVVYEYENGLDSEWHYEWWDGSDWSPAWRAILEYDTQSRLSTITEQFLEEGTWHPSYRYMYVYGDAGLLTEIVEQLRSVGQWINEWRRHMTYENGRVSIDRYDSWLAGQWQPTYRTVNSYAGHLLASAVDQPWTGNDWANEWRRTLQYGPVENVVEDVTQGWTGTTWVNSHRVLHDYQPFLSGESGAVAANGLTVAVYPNPVSTTARVALDGLPQHVAQWVVHDLIGRRVASGSVETATHGPTSWRLDFSGLPNSIYVLQVTVGDQQALARFVIAR